MIRLPPKELFNTFKWNFDWLMKKLEPATFSGKTTYILTDQPINIPKLGPVINSLDTLTDTEISNSVFYVYFNYDSDALVHLKRIIRNNGIIVPHLCFDKTEYRYVNRLADEAIEQTWLKENDITCQNSNVHQGICEAIEITKHLKGDYVEIGVHLGGSALTAGNYLNNINSDRKVWLLDTWDWFNYPEAKNSVDPLWYQIPNMFAGVEKLIAHVKRVLKDTNRDFEFVINNICADELPEQIKEIVVANIDVDLYEATKVALQKVAPLIVKHGIIIVEDPASTPALYGALAAMEEFLETDEGKNFIKFFKGSQYFLLRV